MRSRDDGLWSWQIFEDGAPVIRVEGTLELGGAQGHAGFMCGGPGDDPAFYYAGLSSGDEVVLGSGASSVMTELSRVPLPAGVQAVGSHRLSLECAATGTGVDRVAVWVDDVPALDHVTAGSLGAFDKTAVYAHGDARRFGATFDDARILSGAAYAPVGD